MEERVAEQLWQDGFKTVAMIATSDLEMLTSATGISKELAQKWVQEAVRLIDEETAAKETSP